MRLSQSVVLLIGLAVAAAILVIVGATLSDAYTQLVLLAFGVALFASGLTAFLVRSAMPAASNAMR
jgi:hypothetical protein